MWFTPEKIKELNKRQFVFEFKDEYIMHQYQDKFFYPVVRNFRDEINSGQYMSFKDLVTKTNIDIDRVKKEGTYLGADTQFWDSSILSTLNFHEIQDAFQNAAFKTSPEFIQYYESLKNEVSDYIKNNAIKSQNQTNNTQGLENIIKDGKEGK